MSRPLEQAIEQLRQLPESMQDSIGRSLLLQLEEQSEPGDAEAISAGRADLENGDFVTIEQLRQEMRVSHRTNP